MKICPVYRTLTGKSDAVFLFLLFFLRLFIFLFYSHGQSSYKREWWQTNKITVEYTEQLNNGNYMVCNAWTKKKITQPTIDVSDAGCSFHSFETRDISRKIVNQCGHRWSRKGWKCRTGESGGRYTRGKTKSLRRVLALLRGNGHCRPAYRANIFSRKLLVVCTFEKGRNRLFYHASITVSQASDWAQ